MWVLSTLLLLLLALLVAVAGSSSWQLSSGGIICCCCCCCGSDKVRWYILCLWQPSLKWRSLVVGPAAATTVAASATSAAAAVEQDSGGRKKGEREKREKTGSRLWIWVVLGLHLPACLLPGGLRGAPRFFFAFFLLFFSFCCCFFSDQRISLAAKQTNDKWTETERSKETEQNPPRTGHKTPQEEAANGAGAGTGANLLVPVSQQQ